MSELIEAPGAAPAGEIFDRGYRHYEGTREGRAHAIRALIVYSLKRGLGIKKRWTAKIIPIVLYIAAFLPVIVIVGIRTLASQIPQVAQSFGYGTLFSALSTILLIFAAATAPEMLADDRRQNVLPLYFSRPISRADYVLAKVGALGILMGTISLVPALLLFVADTLLASDPASYLLHHLGLLLRVLATGSLLALYFAAIGLVIASFTDRKAVAAAVYIGAMLVLSGIAAALFHTIGPDFRDYVALVDPVAVPLGLAGWIIGFRSGHDTLANSALGGGWFLADLLVISAVAAGVLYRRYLRHA